MTISNLFLLAVFSITLFSKHACLGIPFYQCKLLDLTHTIKPGIPHWGDIDFEFSTIVDGPVGGNEYIRALKLTQNEHYGTHMDAPNHFFKGARPTNRIPLRNLIGPACVFDISEKIKKTGNRDYGLTLKDIETWETKNGRMPRGCIALVYSGWEFKWGNATDYVGVANASDATNLLKMHYPGIGAEAGEVLATAKRVKGVGTDTLGFDTGEAGAFPQPYPVHHTILGRGLLGFENLKNLHKLPPYGATVALMPMKTEGGSGGPIRAFAVGWDGPDDACKLENRLEQVDKI